MESQARKSTTDLIDRITDGDVPVAFFQAVKMALEQECGKNRPGERGPIDKEAILFRSNVSLGFPKGEIEAITQTDKSLQEFPPIEMVVNFMGLYGPSSPLPTFITEDILQGDGEYSDTRHFLDIFNHRLISFVFRAWEKYRYIEQYKPGATDAFSDKIFSLAGLQQQEVRNKSDIDWERLLPYVALLGMKIRSAWVLQTILKNYFGVEHVSVEEFIETKIAIEKADCNQLGVNNITLGFDASLGNTVKDCSGKILIKMGPLKYSDYRSFSSKGKNHKVLHQLIQYVVSDPIEYDIELELQGKNVPQAMISKANIFMLGSNVWLGKPKEENTHVRLCA
jgi:type VI secretion system protein ImpH